MKIEGISPNPRVCCRVKRYPPSNFTLNTRNLTASRKAGLHFKFVPVN